MKRLAPDRLIPKLRSGEQREAAKEEYGVHLSVLRNIEHGRIPLRLDTNAYFNRFFEFVNSSSEQKQVRVFARLLNLEARSNLLKFGPKFLQQRFVDCVDSGKLDAEYVLFLRQPESLTLTDVKEVLAFYEAFASSIYLHYHCRTSLGNQDTAHTIAIWNQDGPFYTHDWDFKGQVEDLTQWVFKEDHERLRQLYLRIKNDSEPHAFNPRKRSIRLAVAHEVGSIPDASGESVGTATPPA